MARELNVGMKCIQYMLITTNFMFFLIGLLLVAIGVTIKAIYSDFELFMEQSYFSPANLTIAVGVIIGLVSLFGVLGSFLQSTFAINIYAFCLTMVLILQIAAAITAYSARSGIENGIAKKMQNSMKDYNNTNYTADAWDFLQSRLTCCGVHSNVDWVPINITMVGKCHNSEKYADGTPFRYMPGSCFVDNNCKSYYVNGCLDNMTTLISECSTMLGTGAICIAFVEILGIIFSRMLASSVRSIKTQRLVERQRRREELYRNLSANIVVPGEKATYVPTDDLGQKASEA